MKRVIAYIDGFNLYHGLCALNDKSLYWLDLPTLARSLLKPDQTLVCTRYFTARIQAAGRSTQADVQRQAVYLDALAVQPNLTVHYGQFMSKPARCKNCQANWTTFEEKQSDVNLGVELTIDAFRDRFDMALVVSADSDLTSPIERMKQEHPQRQVVVAFPPNRQSNRLKALGPYIAVGLDKLRKAQLPETVISANGYPLTRPITWR